MSGKQSAEAAAKSEILIKSHQKAQEQTQNGQKEIDIFRDTYVRYLGE